MDCPNLEKCGFVKKFSGSKNLAVKGFVSMFCKSEKQCECKRKAFKEAHGYPPPDEMMPNGALMKE